MSPGVRLDCGSTAPTPGSHFFRAYCKAGAIYLLFVVGSFIWAAGSNELARSPDPSRVIVATFETESLSIQEASLWAAISPALPDASGSRINLPFSAMSNEQTAVRAMWAVSESVGQVFNCPSIQLQAPVAFDELPLNLKQALSFGASAPDVPAPNADSADMGSRQSQRYYVLSYEIDEGSPVEYGSSNGEETTTRFRFAENFSCSIDLTNPWYSASDEAAYTAPDSIFAFPASVQAPYAASITSVGSSGSFYYSRGSFEPQQGDGGEQEWSREASINWNGQAEMNIGSSPPYYLRFGSDRYSSEQELRLVWMGILGGLAGALALSAGSDVIKGAEPLIGKSKKS